MNSYLYAIALFASTYAPQGTNQWLYAQTGNGLQVYDPESGEHLQSTYFPTLINNRGLVYDHGRLYMMNQNLLIWRDFMVELHPATSRHEVIGLTGFSIPWADVSLMRDPTTDKYYMQAADDTYVVDMDSGKLTYLGQLEQGVTIITAIAINSRGEVYGYSTPNIWHLRPAIYRVDLHTGKLDLVGDLNSPVIHFRTLAFDSQDRLWGSGSGPFNQQVHRLYRIDLDTLTLHSTFPYANEFPNASAIAFGPKPKVTTYCEPKTNSSGCAPSIAWKGHPSASAHFGFEVRASQVVADSPGFLMLGLGGQASTPFQGGTLCVAEPILRTAPQGAGGSGGCTGTWSVDVNCFLLTQHPLDPGGAFTCQWWGRDPGIAGRDASQLSDALEVVLLP